MWNWYINHFLNHKKFSMFSYNRFKIPHVQVIMIMRLILYATRSSDEKNYEFLINDLINNFFFAAHQQDSKFSYCFFCLCEGKWRAFSQLADMTEINNKILRWMEKFVGFGFVGCFSVFFSSVNFWKLGLSNLKWPIKFPKVTNSWKNFHWVENSNWPL